MSAQNSFTSVESISIVSVSPALAAYFAEKAAPKTFAEKLEAQASSARSASALAA